mmetsp:Transcript_46022/g.146931  ORF Transcript_46022/g.146931 Transcript_46022/m.146931 type:complete len:233 (-) Transcript_46022:397-1095(-)
MVGQDRDDVRATGPLGQLGIVEFQGVVVVELAELFHVRRDGPVRSLHRRANIALLARVVAPLEQELHQDARQPDIGEDLPVPLLDLRGAQRVQGVDVVEGGGQGPLDQFLLQRRHAIEVAAADPEPRGPVIVLDDGLPDGLLAEQATRAALVLRRSLGTLGAGRLGLGLCRGLCLSGPSALLLLLLLQPCWQQGRPGRPLWRTPALLLRGPRGLRMHKVLDGDWGSLHATWR